MPTLPNPWIATRVFSRLAAEPAQELRHDDPDAAAGCFFAAMQTVQLHRLAGDTRRRETVILFVLIRDPGHRLGARAHVGSRDIAVGAEHVVDFVDEFSSDPFEFAAAVFTRVDRDPPFGSAVGKIHDGRLPGHQCSQRAHLVEIDFVVVTQPSFHRPARVIVLDAVPLKNSQFAVVQFDGDLDGDFAARRDEQFAHARGQFQNIRSLIKVLTRAVERFHRVPVIEGT